jgi:D-threo-aldose 1-dehydrogenase
VRQALAHNIWFLDTLNSRAGRSSQRMERAIADHGSPPDGVVVATTVATPSDDLAGPRIRAAITSSAQRLRLPQLPLVYLHLRPLQPFDAITAPGGPLDTLIALRTAGEIGAVGVTSSDVAQLSRSVDLGVIDAIRVHGRWTLLDRSAGPVLDDAAAGIAVVNADVDGGGLLGGTRSGSHPKRATSPALTEAARAMNLVCRWWGTDLATAALLFSLRDRRITSTIGFSTPAHVTATLPVLDADLVEPFWDELQTLVPQ